MLEKLIEREELLMDTPFLRRLRKEAHEEGRYTGRAANAASRYSGCVNFAL